MYSTVQLKRVRGCQIALLNQNFKYNSIINLGVHWSIGIGIETLASRKPNADVNFR